MDVIVQSLTLDMRVYVCNYESSIVVSICIVIPAINKTGCGQNESIGSQTGEELGKPSELLIVPYHECLGNLTSNKRGKLLSTVH